MASDKSNPNQPQKPKGSENVKDLPEQTPGKSTQDKVKGGAAKKGSFDKSNLGKI